jgi:hypothetical protein
MYLLSRDGPCVHLGAHHQGSGPDGRKAHPYWKESEGAKDYFGLLRRLADKKLKQRNEIVVCSHYARPESKEAG